jgi:UDP-N-acetylmuramoyl-L-alanyl-D-glutamate--2,6-diaminopimelate ligase
MNLLLDDIDVVETVGDPASVEVRGVGYDSRRVAPGDLFCCIPGAGADGHAFAREALERGAAALLCEHVVTGLPGPPVVQAAVGTGRVRPAMARVAAAFWGHPSRDLLMAGVTGTNGKTTVAHLLGSIFAAAGRPSTVIGTLTGERTTPEAPDLQRLLAAARAADGISEPAVAVEVSSHALVQSRVDAVHFDVAVFTNLSHDHLDFHGSMEAYFEAKAGLFTPERSVRGVVNADDPWGQRLLGTARVPVTAVSRREVTDVRIEPGRSTFTWRSRRVPLPMTGAVSVHNALLAAEAAIAVGIEPEAVVAGLAAAPTIPGRLEAVAVPGPTGPPFTVLVDYAHTPAGLEVVLNEARALAGTGRRVIVVFGCGGDRDRAKRPLMGAAAGRGADVVVVTSDNPRREDPDVIIDAVLSGIEPSAEAARSAGRLVVEPDRRRAVDRAVGLAGPGDVVVVAGKGHELTQEVGGVRLPFDDRAVVAEVLGARWPEDPAEWTPAGRRAG